MSLVGLNKMLKKILSLVFNFNKKPTLKKYIEAKKCDDFIFENRDFDD